MTSETSILRDPLADAPPEQTVEQYAVAVDGRNDLYGDELDQLTYNSARGESYTSNPYLNEAGVVLLANKLPLAKLLTIDSRSGWFIRIRFLWFLVASKDSPAGQACT